MSWKEAYFWFKSRANRTHKEVVRTSRQEVASGAPWILCPDTRSALSWHNPHEVNFHFLLHQSWHQLGPSRPDTQKLDFWTFSKCFQGVFFPFYLFKHLINLIYILNTQLMSWTLQHDYCYKHILYLYCLHHHLVQWNNTLLHVIST